MKKVSLCYQEAAFVPFVFFPKKSAAPRSRPVMADRFVSRAVGAVHVHWFTLLSCLANVREFAVHPSFIWMYGSWAYPGCGSRRNRSVFPSTLAMAGFGFALTATLTGQPGAGVIVAVIIGTAIGLGNGFLVAYMGVPSIIATIGTQFLWRGIVMLLSQGLTLGLAEVPRGVTQTLLVGRLGGVFPMQALWLLFLTVCLWLLLNRHPWGDGIRFTGEQADIATRLGINVPLARLGVHTLMGSIAGFSGALGCLEMGSWWPTQGEGYMLLVFAAVFIGGTSVYGGSGRVYGTLVGIAIVGMIEAGIISSGLSGFWTRAVHGAVIITAVTCYAFLSGAASEQLHFFKKRWGTCKKIGEKDL